MTNPFEDENGVYHVLINDEGQHSLWPSFIQVPEGWTIVHQSASRAACLEFNIGLICARTVSSNT